jgi:predicted ArsR family transcriptional regulator
MILSELRDYLKQHQRVSLADLVNHFNVNADALRGMLNKWITKGNVRVMPTQSGCGTSCCKCDPSLVELYEWIER